MGLGLARERADAMPTRTRNTPAGAMTDGEGNATMTDAESAADWEDSKGNYKPPAEAAWQEQRVGLGEKINDFPLNEWVGPLVFQGLKTRMVTDDRTQTEEEAIAATFTDPATGQELFCWAASDIKQGLTDVSVGSTVRIMRTGETKLDGGFRKHDYRIQVAGR
jgi:hypothetical protein